MSEQATSTPTTPASTEVNTNTRSAEPAVDGEVNSQPEAPKTKAPKYRKIRVGDEEVALSDDDIARDYSKWKSADQKFREAAEARKSVEAFMQRLQEDPEAVLSDKRLPIDKQKLAVKWLEEQIRTELNPQDPRDAKLSEAERRLKEYEDRDRQAAEAKEKQAYEAAKEQRKTAIAQTLRQAMEATQLSAHPESAAATLREMAMYMRAAKERGEDVTPEELVEHVHNSRFHQLYTLAHQFEGDQLIDFLGEEIVNRIRKADLARLKAKREPQATYKSEAWTTSQGTKPTKKMDGWEAREHARKMLLGK